MTSRLKRCLAAVLLWAAAFSVCAGPSPKRGEVPPDQLGNDRSGQPVQLSQLRGKVVIVTFWASWCGPCRRELPILSQVQKAVGRDHIEVIAVNLREPRSDFVGFIRANRKLDLTYVHDAKGVAAELYGVEAVPNMFVIDQDGRIAYVHRGYSAEMVEVFVQEILALLPDDVLARPAGA